MKFRLKAGPGNQDVRYFVRKNRGKQVTKKKGGGCKPKKDATNANHFRKKKMDRLLKKMSLGKRFGEGEAGVVQQGAQKTKKRRGQHTVKKKKKEPTFA